VPASACSPDVKQESDALELRSALCERVLPLAAKPRVSPRVYSPLLCLPTDGLWRPYSRPVYFQWPCFRRAWFPLKHRELQPRPCRKTLPALQSPPLLDVHDSQTPTFHGSDLRRAVVLIARTWAHCVAHEQKFLREQLLAR
jgi:hypothetical protein